MLAALNCWIYLLVILLQSRRSVGFNGLESREMTTASEPNHCAVIIDRCRTRCTTPGSTVTEYVQMRIKLVDSQTTCTTNMTRPGEPVPVKPNNDNKHTVIFNVPCCQQQRWNGSCENMSASSSVSIPGNTTLSVLVPISARIRQSSIHSTTTTTTTTTTAPPPASSTTSSSIASIPETSNQRKKPELLMILLLIFVILCVVLLGLVLAILLRRREPESRATAKPISQEQQKDDDTQPVAVNGNVRNAEYCYVDKAEDTDRAINDGNRDSSEAVTNSGSANSHTKEEDASPSSDYIVLPNQSFPAAPKSARPSRSRQGESSEEVIIVGAKNMINSPILGTEFISSHNMPNNFSSGNVLTKSEKNWKNPLNSEMKQCDAVLFVTESNGINTSAFGTTGRLPSKPTLTYGSSTNEYDNEDCRRNRAQTDLENPKWENSPDDYSDNIYNRLRNNNKPDDCYSDYSRLQRQSQSQENAPSESDRPYYNETKGPDYQWSSSNKANGNSGYVTSFMPTERTAKYDANINTEDNNRVDTEGK